MLDTKYKENTLYNNLNENLLKESIIEVRLNIDSIDRDPYLYPNPFNYVVNLGPIVNSGINSVLQKANIKNEAKNLLKKTNNNKKNKLINRESVSLIIENKEEYKEIENIFNSPDLIKEYTINLERNNNPFIIRDFNNVKFLRLDTAVVPKFNSLGINYDWDYCREKNHRRNYIKDDYERIKDYSVLNNRYIPDDSSIYAPIGDRFVQIYIKEINNNYSFGTNSITDKSFLLIFDKILGGYYFKLIPYSAIQTYRDSLLGNINKLTIQFYDSYGIPLTINTSCIDYEKNQILNTEIINPSKCNIEEIFNNIQFIDYYIEKMTEIIKCFVAINNDIKYKIPFYNTKNIINENEINDNCKFENIILNQKEFEVKNIYEELNKFVSKNGFIDIPKITKSGKYVKLSINQYINNIIWYNLLPENIESIKKNIMFLDINYNLFGFTILDKLKTELIEIPVNKYFQNFLSFSMGIYMNELNTKIDYNH